MIETVLFWIFAVLAVLGGAGVVLSRSPLNGAMSLVGAFFALAGLYLLLSAQLLAALQVLVYAGAIMVLFLFVIMLLNVGADEVRQERIGPIRGGVATLTSLAALALVGREFLRIRFPFARPPSDFGTVAAVGRVLFSDFTLPFEATSLLLLAGILGAVVVAKGKI